MERKGSNEDMCGIIAVLRRPSDRKVPTAERITAPLVGAVDLLARVEPDQQVYGPDQRGRDPFGRGDG